VFDAVSESIRDTATHPLRERGVATRPERPPGDDRASVPEAQSPAVALQGPAGASPAAVLGAALDATSDAFVVLDLGGIVYAANARAAELCGCPGESLEGRPFLELLPDSAAAALGPELAAAARGDRRSRDLHIHDSQTWYVAHVYPANDRLVLHLHDVTERRNAEDALAFLARAGQTLAGVLEERQLVRVIGRLAVPRLADWCLIALPAAGGAFRFDAWAVTKATRRRVLGIAQRHRIAPDLASAFGPASAGDASGPFNRPPELHQGANGSDVWPLSSSVLTVLLSGDGRRGGGALIFGRGADRPPFDPSDARLGNMLATRVSVVLDKVRLYEAERRATRLREEVLAIVAHDLRNPLNAIVLGASALSTRRPEDEALAETARRTVALAADQMNSLIDDLVNAAYLDAGWAPRQPAVLDVPRLIGEWAEVLRWRAEKKGVRLETVLEGTDGLRIEGDADRLREAVGNLVDNAIRFTPRAGTVTLAASRVPRGVQLSVSDTGPGIDPEAMPRLFDRFWQAQQGRRAGAGLGLFIARRIVEGHGGTISAESLAGHGSVFRILLPSRSRRQSRGEPDTHAADQSS